MGGALDGFAVVSLPIVLGYVVARTGLLSPGAHGQINRLVFFAFMPALLFTVVSETELSVVFSKLALASLVTALVTFALYALLAGAIWRRPADAVVVGTVCAGYTNAGNIGLPVSLLMLGNAALVAPVILFQTVVFSPIALAAMSLAAGQKATPRQVLVAGLANPVALGSTIGLVMAALPWQVPSVLAGAIGMIGWAGVPLMLLALGMSLRGRPVFEAGPGRRDAIVAIVFKLLVMPLLGYLLARFAFGFGAHGIYVVTVLACLPAAGNTFNYAQRYNVSVALARDTVTGTTVAGALVLLAVAAMLG